MRYSLKELVKIVKIYKANFNVALFKRFKINWF